MTDAAVTAARFFCLAALLGGFGALLFRLRVAPRALPPAAPALAAVDRLVFALLAGSLAGLIAWCGLQSARFAGAETLGAAVRAVPVVLLRTRFGHLVLGQAALLAVALISRRRRTELATLAAGAAVGLAAAQGHLAALRSPGLLLASGVVHLLAAGAWLGALPPLLIVLCTATPMEAARAARHFSPLGKACVAATVASAAVQFWYLIGGVPGLLATDYGRMAVLKIALFLALFALAVLNRYRLAPALLGADPGRARRRLGASLAVQTVAGLATILAAALLSALPPAVHPGGQG